MAINLMTNPSNHLPPQYDDIQPFHYDPSFTETINTTMRVPHKLAAVSGLEAPDDYGQPPVSQTTPMTVPERIIVAGHDQHIGMKENTTVDMDPLNKNFQKDFVGLSTPPRVLTLEERPFPSLDDSRESAGYKEDGHNMAVYNGYVSTTPKGSSLAYDLLATPGDGLLLQDDDMDDITMLRRQVIKLGRHVVRLEEENSRRSQREFFLYPLIIGYILLQVVKRLLQTN